MANPMADSAAATVNIKSAKICPSMLFKIAEVNIKPIDAESNIISMEISINIMLFWLETIPAKPIKNICVQKSKQLSK